MKNLAKIFQVLSDSTRLRILKLLNLGQLSVLEFQKILKTTQSATSRHLRILREIGLIKEHRFGQSVYYRRMTNSSSDNNANIINKINSFMETILKDQSFKEDEIAYQNIIQLREKKTKNFFAGDTSRWDEIRTSLFSKTIEERAIRALIPNDLKILDIGCGLGYFLRNLKDYGDQIIGIDNSFKIIREAKRNLNNNISLLCGNALNLPFKTHQFDIVFCLLVLHYISDPSVVIKEMVRIVKEKGKIVILDFLPHHTDWYESLSRKLGFVWQGFHLEDVRLWFKNNNVIEIALQVFDHNIGIPDNQSNTKKNVKTKNNKTQKPKLKNQNLKLFMAIGSR